MVEPTKEDKLAQENKELQETIKRLQTEAQDAERLREQNAQLEKDLASKDTQIASLGVEQANQRANDELLGNGNATVVDFSMLGEAQRRQMVLDQARAVELQLDVTVPGGMFLRSDGKTYVNADGEVVKEADAKKALDKAGKS